MGPEGLNQRVPVTPSRTEPETFRLVAQCLKQLRHHSQEQRVLYIKTNTYFLFKSRSILLRMENVSDKYSGENQIHILCSITFSFNIALFQIMRKNTVELTGHS
jgi:hypothetical protein